MTILKALTLSDAKPLRKDRNKLSTLDRAKAKFAANLKNQLDAAETCIAGKAPHTVPKVRYVTADSGDRQRVEKDMEVRPWWFEQKGAYFVTIRYANKALELAKGKPSIAAGETLETVKETLDQIKQALEAGELDHALESAAKDARKRMHGK